MKNHRRGIPVFYVIPLIWAAILLRRYGPVPADYIDLSLPFLAVLPYVNRRSAPLFAAYALVFALSFLCFLYYPQPVRVDNIIVSANIALALLTLALAVRS